MSLMPFVHLSRVFGFDAFEERLEVEPAVEAIILAFCFNQAQEVLLLEILQLDVRAMVTSWSHFLPLFVR